MIERFYLKDYLSFKEVELEFENGLVVFSGPSGSGKSILMNSILATLGFSDAHAARSEATVSWDIDESSTGIENEECNVFTQVKKEKVRYFINTQAVSKKSIKNIASTKLRHLSLKDYSDFEQSSLIELIDGVLKSQKKDISKELATYKENFKKFKTVQKELKRIEDERSKLVELKEFAQFEISKIEDINPINGEDEELIEVKKLLSLREKTQEKIQEAEAIYELEYAVSSALNSLDIDSGFFDDAMNELRTMFDLSSEKFNALDDVNIEEVLDRIEALSSLKRRYGSIEEALKYKEEKKEELKRYENIDVAKDDLEKEYEVLSEVINSSAEQITIKRKGVLKACENTLNNYLKDLYMRPINISLKECELSENGKDAVELLLNGTTLDKISSGEFNRLRLAFLALKSESMSENGGLLMLDEIDANLSGEESMSVARVLRKLSKKFQIFVISHQPQLTSMGEHHYLVHRNENSQVKKLNEKERISEIARMISGEKITNEAMAFATELLKKSLSV
ncbi:MAG: AAA family ATPase [Helicobacteraceae bacterium]|nr:AAA family ATPase [Helicobacteraceae bacterium]